MVCNFFNTLSVKCNDVVGWLVVLGLMACLDSISVYIGPSPREREKEERNDRREKHEFRGMLRRTCFVPSH